MKLSFEVTFCLYVHKKQHFENQLTYGENSNEHVRLRKNYLSINISKTFVIIKKINKLLSCYSKVLKT